MAEWTKKDVTKRAHHTCIKGGAARTPGPNASLVVIPNGMKIAN
jgi:hypothetical protein